MGYQKFLARSKLKAFLHQAAERRVETTPMLAVRQPKNRML